MGEYRLIFDVVQVGYRHWWFPTFGLLFVLLGFVFAKAHGFPGFRGRPFRFAPYYMITFASCWVALVFVSTYSDYCRLRRAMERHNYVLVEGPVTAYWETPVKGKAAERFVVAGRRFEYSDDHVIAGYNNTASRGGAIRDGLCVRIFDVGGEIARLEVARAPILCTARVIDYPEKHAAEP
jgi:hypothetical protein